MKAIACIGVYAKEAIPHIVEVLKNPNPVPEEYYNVSYIQRVGAQTLGTLGKAAAEALPTLREIAKSAEPDLKSAAIAAIREIERE